MDIHWHELFGIIHDYSKIRLVLLLGLSAGAISETIKKLIDKNLLVCFLDNLDMGRIKKYYMLSQYEGSDNITYAIDKETEKILSYDKWLESLNITAYSKNEIASNKNSVKNVVSDSETIEKSSLSKNDDIYSKYSNLYKSYQSDRSIDNNKDNQSINQDKDKYYDNQSIDHKDFITIDSVPSYKKLKQNAEKPGKEAHSINETSANTNGTKNESHMLNAIIGTLKNKYALDSDDIDVCLSRMKGKDIKYPAKFLWCFRHIQSN